MKKDVKKSGTKAASVRERKKVPSAKKGKTGVKTVNVKALRAFTLIVLALVILLAVVLLIVKGNVKPKKLYAYSDQIYYFPARFDEDIFQNTAYLTFDRSLLFGTQNYQSYYQYETDRETAPEEARFFLDYFHCLMYGEEDGIIDFFVPGYFEDKNNFTEIMVGGKPHFTMQMIHDMSVILHSEDSEKIEGEETLVYSYTVKYPIYHNNGTWRKGVGDDEIRPQVYQLIRDEEENYRIWRILDVFVENENEE